MVPATLDDSVRLLAEDVCAALPKVGMFFAMMVLAGFTVRAGEWFIVRHFKRKHNATTFVIRESRPGSYDFGALRGVVSRPGGQGGGKLISAGSAEELEELARRDRRVRKTAKGKEHRWLTHDKRN